MSKETIRLNFEYSRENYPYLKFLCSKRRTTLKKMLTDFLDKEIEKSEELELAKTAEERIRTRKDDDLIDWNEAKKLAGWE